MKDYKTITREKVDADPGYRPHWATCPQADHFKRGGRRRG